MPTDDIDFEGGGVVEQPTQTPDNTDNNPANQEDMTALNGGEVNDVTGKDGTSNEGEEKPAEDSTTGDESDSNTELEEGTTVEFEGNVYTVDENGNLVDKDNKIFKEKKDVAKWLADNDFTDSENVDDFSIEGIKAAIGIDITDAEGNAVEFSNDAKGVTDYVNSVMDLKSRELQEGAINKLFSDMPILREFINYLQLNGSPRGFGDIPDRSGVQIDKDNPEQQKAIIRMAAKEFGNKSLNENYIKYLEDSGSLYDEAKTQLEALVGKDKAYKQELEQRAETLRQEQERSIQEYWEGVANRIGTREIGGYKLPENFVKEINGQKYTLTIEDFNDYVSKPKYQDEEGNVMTAYQRDLNALSNEQALDRELLDAWLMFTGGSYKDLVNMKIQEEKVRVLKQKAKQLRTTRTIKVKKSTQSKVNPNDILLS